MAAKSTMKLTNFTASSTASTDPDSTLKVKFFTSRVRYARSATSRQGPRKVLGARRSCSNELQKDGANDRSITDVYNPDVDGPVLGLLLFRARYFIDVDDIPVVHSGSVNTANIKIIHHSHRGSS